MAKDKIDHVTEMVNLGFANLDARIERGFVAIAEDIADLRVELKGDIAGRKGGGVAYSRYDEAVERSTRESFAAAG
jgi:hypothetical protein